jgi:hypothetical protein
MNVTSRGIISLGASSINQWPLPLMTRPSTFASTRRACSIRNFPEALSPVNTSIGIVVSFRQIVRSLLHLVRSCEALQSRPASRRAGRGIWRKKRRLASGTECLIQLFGHGKERRPKQIGRASVAALKAKTLVQTNCARQKRRGAECHSLMTAGHRESPHIFEQ